jgi:hypothetical protein
MYDTSEGYADNGEMCINPDIGDEEGKKGDCG